MSQTIEYACACGMCGQTSLDSVQAMFNWRRQILPKVEKYIYRA